MFSTIITSADISTEVSQAPPPAPAWLCLSPLKVLEAAEKTAQSYQLLQLGRRNTDKDGPKCMSLRIRSPKID